MSASLAPAPEPHTGPPGQPRPPHSPALCTTDRRSGPEREVSVLDDFAAAPQTFVVPLPRPAGEPDDAAFAADAGVAATLAQAFEALREERARQRAHDLPVFPMR